MPIYQHKTYTDDSGRLLHVRVHEPQDNEDRLPSQFMGQAIKSLPDGRRIQFEFAIREARSVADAFKLWDGVRDETEKVMMAEVAPKVIAPTKRKLVAAVH